MRRAAGLLAACALACAALPSGAAARSIAPYRGTGAWIDRTDAALYADPAPAIAQMAAAGARTLYIQTGNYKLAHTDIVHPAGLAAAIEEAHAAGMTVVGWYLPGLVDRGADLRRMMEAVDFTTPLGQRLDSFAVDIESTAVGPLGLRNLSLVKLSRSLRRTVGRHYALGAIVPDERSSTIAPALWPAFPFGAIRPYYDVVLPMAYSTYRGHGSSFVYGYTAENVRFAKAMTRRPVHLIAGIANGLRGGEPAAAIRAARAGGAVGASFYDVRTSGLAEWRALASWAR